MAISMKILALSGARSGSSGLPHKNILDLCGKPLLAWPLEISKRSKYIHRHILSTDSEKYAEIAKKHGFEVPFIQPKETAMDTSTVFEFISHALDWLERNENYVPDIVVYLCPTTPLVRYEDVDKAIEILMEDPEAHSVVLVSHAKGHPRKTVKLAPSGVHVVSYITERGRDVSPSNRQSHEKAFNRESLPVISRTKTIREIGSQAGDLVRYHLISEETAHDIDNALDFFLAQELIKRRENNNTQS